MRWFRRLRIGRQGSGQREAEYAYEASLPSPLRWRLAAAIAKVAGLVVTAIALLLSARQSRYVKSLVDALVPDSALRNLRSEDAAERVDTAKRKLRTELEREQAPSRRTFGVGSTKTDVLAIQGEPDRKTDSTWWYGESEVYFVGGLVVGSKPAPGSPLKMR